MTASQVLSITKEKGIILEAHGRRLEYKAPLGAMSEDLIKLLKSHKGDLLHLLTQEKSKVSPGDCESCLGGGLWDWKGAGMWCFHDAYFLGSGNTDLIPNQIHRLQS